VKAIWKRAGRNLMMGEVVQCDLGWAGLPHAHRTKVRLWISSGKDKFDSFDQLFDFAAAVQFKPHQTQSGSQQQQGQAEETLKGGDKKCKFGPSVSEYAEHTSGNSNNSITSHSKSVYSSKPSRGSPADLI